MHSTCAMESAVLRHIALPLNHCNLPARELAGLYYQQQPVPLQLDGVTTLYHELFARLEKIPGAAERAEYFEDYMAVRFRLPEAGLEPNDAAGEPPRPKMNYRRLLLGWLFDSDNDQGAAWRSWVESRFGLLTCFHKHPLYGPDSFEYLRFRQACARATYNTNELDSQLDLLYSFCQYELQQRYPDSPHITLYRGCAEPRLYRLGGETVKLFNNLSSFSCDPEEAQRFGSRIFATRVPLTKIVCFDSLLPRTLGGEQEYMVLGGLYRVQQVL